MKVRARRWMRIASVLLAETILVGVSGLPAYAQFPDVLSNVECPGCSAQLAGMNRVGVCVAPSRATAHHTREPGARVKS